MMLRTNDSSSRSRHYKPRDNSVELVPENRDLKLRKEGGREGALSLHMDYYRSRGLGLAEHVQLYKAVTIGTWFFPPRDFIISVFSDHFSILRPIMTNQLTYNFSCFVEQMV